MSDRTIQDAIRDVSTALQTLVEAAAANLEATQTACAKTDVNLDTVRKYPNAEEFIRTCLDAISAIEQSNMRAAYVLQMLRATLDPGNEVFMAAVRDLEKPKQLH